MYSWGLFLGRLIAYAEVPRLGIVGLEEPFRDDRERLIEFFSSLSEDTIMLRFLRPLRFFEPEVDRILDRSHTPVAVIASREKSVIGSGEVYKIKEGEGELAIVVHDKYRRRGLGTLIMYMLFVEAKRKGIVKIHAYTHETNIPMKKLAQKFQGVVAGMIEEDMYDIIFNTDSAIEAGAKALKEKGITIKIIEPDTVPSQIPN